MQVSFLCVAGNVLLLDLPFLYTVTLLQPIRYRIVSLGERRTCSSFDTGGLPPLRLMRTRFSRRLCY
ncbi:hypothetical protein Hanom_Chr14g01290371 [Helianthus anomalus]